MQQFGEIKSFEVIKDLTGKNSALEIYYQNDHSVNLAVKYVNNKEYDGYFLHVKSFRNWEEEEIDNKTLIIKNLNRSVSQEGVLNELEKYGHVLKLEMPLVNRINSADKQGKIFNLADNYLNILMGSIDKISETSKSDQIQKRAKLNFYFNYMNKIIEKFKATLYNNSDSITPETQINLLNNLLVEINFFLRKFFPDTIINSIIKQEYDELAKRIKSGNTNI